MRITGPALKNFIVLFALLILFKCALDWSYEFVLVPVWGKEGFLLSFNTVKCIESYILLLLILFMLPKTNSRLSGLIIWMLVIVSYVPMLTMYAYMDLSRAYMYAVTGFWILVLALMKHKGFKIGPVINGRPVLVIAISLFYAVTIAILLLYANLPVNIDLSQRYAIRQIYMDTNIPLAGYIFPWMANVVNTFVFSLSVIRRKWPVCIVTILIQAWLYFVTAQLLFLLALPFIVLMIWLTNQKGAYYIMVFGALSTVIIGAASYNMLHDVLLSSMLAHRIYITPAYLSFMYYDFFSSHELIYLSYNKIVSRFVDYPYDLSPAYLIGQVYFNSATAEANNGIYSDAYMNFGYLGFILWGLALTAILKIVDALSANKSRGLAMAAIAIPASCLVNGQLTVCLMTHGILLGLLVMFLLPEKHTRETGQPAAQVQG